MDRCIVLVDAGYLLGAAASLLAGEPSRSRITVDHPALIQGLRDRAENDTRRPLLRIYWFDGAPDRVPQPEHRRLRVMPRVTVRLGALTRSDGRWAQKGVDAAMHAELTELARNRACSDIVLVTGDGDLLPGMMAAKEHGVAVHLWAVQAADGDYNQSEDLVAEADERRVLDRAWITQAVRAKEAGGICAPPPAPRPEIAAILSAPLPRLRARRAGAHRRSRAHPALAAAHNGAAERAPAPRACRTPKDLAALRHGPGCPPRIPPPPPCAGPPAEGRWHRPGSPSRPSAVAMPTLAQLTTAEQRWADREEDITTVGRATPSRWGRSSRRRWISRRSGRPGSSPAAVRAHVSADSAPHRPASCCGTPPGFGLLASRKDDQIDGLDRLRDPRLGFWREVDSPHSGGADALALRGVGPDPDGGPGPVAEAGGRPRGDAAGMIATGAFVGPGGRPAGGRRAGTP
ncbi:NYN domain-containing protein OS=Streptomyces tendae OX=1932 GN=F3L20_23875 PE=4 SV=1 [Streptomyces tendae]